jgi:predicted lysophospholipase L1 biosynthesis ABC-type transport system permease subunit
VAPALASSYNVDIHPVFHGSIALIGLGLSFVFSHLASILPVAAALSVSPTSILRQGQILALATRRSIFIAYVLVICLAMSGTLAIIIGNFAGFIIVWALLALTLVLVMIARFFLAAIGRLVANRNALANIAVSSIRTFRLRSASTIVGVAISTLIAVTLLSSISMLRSSLSQSASSYFNVIVESPLDRYREEQASIESIDGVTSVDPTLFAMGKLEGDERDPDETSANVRAPGIQGIVDGNRSVPPIVAGENLPEAGRKQDEPIPALVSEKTAESRLLSLGDQAQLTTNNRSVTVSIRGIYKHLPVNLGDAIIVRADALPADTWLSSMLMVSVDPPARSGEIAKTINDQLPNSFAFSFEQLIPSVNMIINNKWIPVIGLGLLAAMAGLIVCISGIFLSLNQHSLDFGIIKAIGGTKRTLIKLVGYEYALIGISGTLGGITLGMLLLFVIGRMLLQTVAQPSIMLILETFFAVTLLVEAIALVFAHFWIRTQPMKLLRDD